jgi:hypothetical protein
MKIDSSFNWKQYIDNYPDLQGVLSTQEDAWKHWIRFGKNKERRTDKKIEKYKEQEEPEPQLLKTTEYNEEEIEIMNPVINNNIVYIICNNRGGGSWKYLKDIISKYTHISFIFIKTKFILNNLNIKKNSIIIIQYFLDIDIDIQNIIDIIKEYDLRLIIPLHDFIWFNSNIVYKYISNGFNIHRIYLNKDVNPNSKVKELFYLAENVISPSKFIKDEYSKYFHNSNNVVVDHNDYLVQENIVIPKIINNTINIGIFHEMSYYKGKEYYTILEKIKKYKTYNINYLIPGINIPKYTENEFYIYLKNYNINILTFLNKWGETWCYSLTKAINSGLPIFYNNLGAFKERIPKKNHYFINNEQEEENIDSDKLIINFKKILDYVIDNNKDNHIIINENIKYNIFYDNLFINKKKNIFPIYFPQFHEFKENNLLFYNKFTDIVNLNEVYSKYNLKTPCKSTFNLNNILDYNLTNNTIIQKQFELLYEYNLSGFGVYYYWFSNNTITNNNKIMNVVIDQFFNKSLNTYGKKIFFIWANENWSDNPAFGQKGKHSIINIYNKENILKNCNQLIKYFKQDIYLKVNNKPVFFIHHPWTMITEEINLFKNTLDKLCISNKFSGIEIILNGMNGNYDNYHNYDSNPNYKKNIASSIVNGSIILDYKKYINNVKMNKKNIQTIFFDFCNKARLYKPDRLSLSTTCVNNDIENINLFIDKINNHYLKNKSTNYIDNILLVNSWNEWGENMSIEPSNENGKFYLDLIKNKLL